MRRMRQRPLAHGRIFDRGQRVSRLTDFEPFAETAPIRGLPPPRAGEAASTLTIFASFEAKRSSTGYAGPCAEITCLPLRESASPSSPTPRWQGLRGGRR